MTVHNDVVQKLNTEIVEHIDNYVAPRYGEYEWSELDKYTVEDCVKHAQRYLTRFGKSSRPGEEKRDIVKAIHYLAAALHKMDDAPETFAGTPVSIEEIKSRKSGLARDWTPRTALLKLLREIDSGERKIDDLVAMYATNTDDGGVHMGYLCATASYFNTLGVIEAGKAKIVKDAEID